MADRFAAATFSGQVDFGGGYGSTGATVETTGNFKANGTLTVDGAVTLGSVAVTGAGAFGGTLTAKTSLTLNGVTSGSGVFSVASTGGAVTLSTNLTATTGLHVGTGYAGTGGTWDASGNLSTDGNIVSGGSFSASTNTLTSNINGVEVGSVGIAGWVGMRYAGLATNSYAFIQNNAGSTCFNAASGQHIEFDINNSSIVFMTSASLYPYTNNVTTLGSATRYWSNTFSTKYNNITVTTPGTGATLTLADNSTLVTAGAYSTTLTSTAATSVTLPTAGQIGGIAASATPAATGTIAIANTAAISQWTITPTGACTFNASGGTVGQRVTFAITTAGTTTYALTWSGNYKPTGVLNTGGTAGKIYLVEFELVGTNWVEISRTTGL